MPTTVTPRLTGAPSDRLDTEVREIMRAGVVTITAHASLRQALRAIATHDEHSVLVTDDAGLPVGWITAGGLLTRADTDAAMVTARSAIDEPVVRIHPTATAREALELLRHAGASHLLVAHSDDMAPEGVISPIDVLRLIAQ